MQIDILYFDGCPNQRHTAALVRDIVQSHAFDATIREVEVRDVEEAVRLRFFGSPTVQVDGEDVDPAVRNRTDYSFSCRMYGRAGSPPRELVEEALRKHSAGPHEGRPA